MKTIKIFLAFFISLLLLYCSPDIGSFSWDGWTGSGDIEFPWYGNISVSDDCDCLEEEFPWNCSDHYYLLEDEFKRLLLIINQSTEPCIFIQGVDYNDEPFEGYVISFYPDE